jgi:putative transposase
VYSPTTILFTIGWGRPPYENSNMSRYRRNFVPGGTYFFTRHSVWTLPPQDAAYPLRWKQIKERFTSAYLANGGEEASVSASRHAKRERGVWQRRYYEHTVRDEADLRHCIDYVHINPIKHRLVDSVVDWPWSSFHRYLALGEYTPDWGADPTFHGDEWLKYE